MKPGKKSYKEGLKVGFDRMVSALWRVCQPQSVSDRVMIEKTLPTDRHDPSWSSLWSGLIYTYKTAIKKSSTVDSGKFIRE